ncbi:hypothetical protein [Candidatus Kuenenia stuttgartiensis]|uniref:hypothetical protein n=1 Tax=Kuenenia stuttgartiensis TaxID=174633 RepID=UPI00146F4CE2|nr:hypothetical protein [Candidatus Kuenenia stuttgartiensis]
MVGEKKILVVEIRIRLSVVLKVFWTAKDTRSVAASNGSEAMSIIEKVAHDSLVYCRP